MTVIVPARDAAATLPRTLDALAASAVEHEVIVVDDASRDDTAAIAEGRGARVVRNTRAFGPARSRNTGAALASAPLLAFTDADCVPEPGWLDAGIRALRDADLVTGPIVPERPPGPFDRTLDRPGPSPLFETANLLVRREVFARLGGFSPFGGARPEDHFGEDAIFGWRARAAGARVAFAPDATVAHAVFERRARDWIAERRRLRFFPALVREVPGLRTHLTARVFLSANTARFDAAVAGLAVAVARRRPWPLLAAVPYAARAPRDLRVAAARIAGDSVGLAALAGGSLAARRVVL